MSQWYVAMVCRKHVSSNCGFANVATWKGSQLSSVCCPKFIPSFQLFFHHAYHREKYTMRGTSAAPPQLFLVFSFPSSSEFSPILFFSQGVSSGVKFVSYDTPSAKYTPTHIVFIVNSGACRWTYKLLQDTAKNKIYLYCIYFLYTIYLHATYMWYVISVYTCRVLVTYQLPFLEGSVFLESLQLVCKVIPAEFSSDFPLFCPYSSVYFPALFLAGVC